MEVFKLTRKRVREEVPNRKPGFYRLGNTADGEFYTGYVGRSDTCLRRRLKNHASKGLFTHFVARPMSTREQAYYEECLIYHLEGNEILNKNHPGTPDEMDLNCPYCRFEKRISETKEEDNKMYINNVA